jgi:yeast amino acid transporter
MLVVIVALNVSIPIFHSVLCLTMEQFFPVKVYGESDFWFASLKVITIFGLLILSFILFWGGAPSHQRLGFHY